MILNYGKHHIDKDDIKGVVKTLKSNFLTQGDLVNKFEGILNDYFGSNYSTVLSNGTAALFIALKSFGFKENEKVLTTPITFVSTVSTILMNNLIPKFADINKIDYTLDLNRTEDLIKKDKKIKAIIGVDYAGHPCDWKSLKFLKKKYNLKLLNDNCHALGARLDNNLKYAIKYADIVTQSYHPVKNFTTGEGGAILTNDNKINKFAKNYRSHFMIKSKNISKKFGNWRYTVDDLGFNYRLTDIQCSLGITQLKKLNKFIKRRQEIASYYNSNFENLDLIKTPEIRKNVNHSFHLYPLMIDFKKLKISKKQFFQIMLKEKINLQVHYTPIYHQNFVKKFKFDKKDYPITEDFYRKEVSLPIFYDLKKDLQKNLIKKIKMCIYKNAK